MSSFVSCYSYGAPEVSSYGAPEPSYAEPVVEEYSAPAYTAEGEVLDIGSLVLPILVIVGEWETIVIKKKYLLIDSIKLCSFFSPTTSTWPLLEGHSMTMGRWLWRRKSRMLLRQYWKTRIFWLNMIKYVFIQTWSMWYSQYPFCHQSMSFEF